MRSLLVCLLLSCSVFAQDFNEYFTVVETKDGETTASFYTKKQLAERKISLKDIEFSFISAQAPLSNKTKTGFVMQAGVSGVIFTVHAYYGVSYRDKDFFDSYAKGGADSLKYDPKDVKRVKTTFGREKCYSATFLGEEGKTYIQLVTRANKNNHFAVIMRVPVNLMKNDKNAKKGWSNLVKTFRWYERK